MRNKTNIFEQATGSTATTTGSTATERTRQQNVNSMYCSVRNGVITNKASQFRNTLWSDYTSKFIVKPEEIAAAEKACPGTATLVRLTPEQISQKFIESAKTLGIENPGMDVQTVQAVLNILNPQQAVTESKIYISEEINKMKYLLGYQRGKVISEQQSNPQLKQLLSQLQTVLKDKFNQAIGIDGNWGNISQVAFEDAVKSVDITKRRQADTQQTGAIQQAVDKSKVDATALNVPQVPGIQQRPQNVTPTSTEQDPLLNRDQRRDRQDLRRDQRRTRQDLRTQQRAEDELAATQTGGQVDPLLNRDQRRDTQDLRRDQRRTRQDLRTQQRDQRQ
jgi:hypothetical protein